MPASRKEPVALTVAMQMREAIGYLAALASRSDLEAIARKLLGIHIDLDAEIAALIDEAERVPDAPAANRSLIRRH